MRIGELARQARVRASALRYYEEAGLLPPPERTEAGYRLYSQAAVGRLSFIRRAQALGLSVREIRELIAGEAAAGHRERSRIRHVVAHKLAETDRRIAELTSLREELAGLHARLHRAPGPECGHVGDCGCWLPTEEEVMAMSAEVRDVEQCGCCDCPEPGCECGCDCCAAG